MRPARSYSARLLWTTAAMIALAAGIVQAQPPAGAPAGQRPGRSGRTFSQPSIAPGVDCTTCRRTIEQRIRPDGQIEGICVGTTAAHDAVYYCNRPTDLKAMQGCGPVLMAGAEVRTMVWTFNIRRTDNTFYCDRKIPQGRP